MSLIFSALFEGGKIVLKQTSEYDETASIDTIVKAYQ